MFYCFAFEALALELDCLRGAVQADFQWPYWWQLKRMSKTDGFLRCLKLKLRKEWEGADKNLVWGRGAVDVGFLYGCWRRFDWIARKARLSAWCMGFSSSESMLVALILSYCWPICWSLSTILISLFSLLISPVTMPKLVGSETRLCMQLCQITY